MAVSLRDPVKIFVDENTDLVSNLEHEFVKLKRRLGTSLPAVPPLAKRESSSTSNTSSATSTSKEERMDVDVEADAQDAAVTLEPTTSTSTVTAAATEGTQNIGGEDIADEVLDAEADENQSDEDDDGRGDDGDDDDEDEDGDRGTQRPRKTRGGRRHKKQSIMDRFPIDIDRDAIVASALHILLLTHFHRSS